MTKKAGEKTLNYTCKVSVIVPVYKQWDELRCLIDALDKQTFEKKEWQLIVVDNEGITTDVVNNITSSEAGRDSQILYCKKPG